MPENRHRTPILAGYGLAQALDLIALTAAGA
jgi:hypothetical protein